MVMIEVRCTSCDALLVAESFAGPPRRTFAPAQVEVVAFRAGWRDGVCWECRTGAVP